MKTFRLLLAMLLTLWCPTVFAQSPEDYDLDMDHPLITDLSQLSSPWCADHSWEGNLAHLLDNDVETYWHSDWGKNTVAQWVQVQLNEPTHELVALWFIRRWHNYNSTVECTTNHVTKWSFWGSDDPEAKDEDWVKLGECSTPYSTPGETLNTIGFDTQGKLFLRIAAEETNTGNRCWHAAELQLYPAKLAVSELDAAIHELTDTYFQYEGYQDGFVANIGTLPGQYPSEIVEAFVAALDAALTIDDQSTSLTVEDVRAMIEDIKNTYQAVLDSTIPFSLEDGYYRIRHSCVFINNVPTGEVDGGGDPIYEEREVKKYIYTQLEGDKIRAFWNTPAEDALACPYIWKVTNVDGFFDIFNCGTDARFDNVPKNDNVTLSKESTNVMAIDLVHNVGGDPHVTLRVSTQQGTDHTFLHPLNHGIQAADGMGRGVQGYIMGWANDKYGVSEWVFERVSDEEAEAAIEAYEPYKNRAVMVANFTLMRDDIGGKLEIAKDLSVAFDEEKPYITDLSQLSSPWCAPHDWEGNLEHLIDNDPLTYWHTDWGNNSSWQYVQVALNEPVHELTAMHVIRRKYKYNSTTELCTADQVTVWGVQGSDTPDADDADWVELATLVTPYQAPGEEITVAFDTQGKQYLRFYAKETNSGRRSWHCAEFQLYPGEIIDPATSQFHMMGDVAATMDNLYNELKDIDAETVTPEQYTAFKAAYDAFIDRFVDPEVLRAKIASAEGADAIIEIGDNPGFWKDNSASGVLTKAIADAKAYDEAGIYSKESCDAQIAALDKAVANIKNTANPIQTGKWYRIRFGTEEEYAAHNWETGGNATDYRMIEGVDTETVLNPSNFGSCMTVARLEQLAQEDEHGAYTQNIIEPVDADEVAVGDILYHTDPDNIENPDMALFRFIPYGDAFIIQNKATGLFLQKKVENNDGICLSVTPSFFSQEVAGYGQNALFIKTLCNESQNPMHFARNKNVVITWGSWGDRDGRRGCFYIEEVEDVEPDYAVNVTRIPMIEGGMKPCCYPVTLQATDGQGGALWTVASIEREGANVTVTLGQIAENKAEAGRPFIYIDEGDYDEENEPLPIEFTFAYDVVGEPQNDGALKGVFTRTTIGQGVLTIGATEMTRTSDTNAAVNTNSAYIAEDEKFPYNTELEVVLDYDVEDGIESVLKTVAKTGDIYTLDGRLVGRGNLNSLKGLKKGAYIVNGIKVLVK